MCVKLAKIKENPTLPSTAKMDAVRSSSKSTHLCIVSQSLSAAKNDVGVSLFLSCTQTVATSDYDKSALSLYGRGSSRSVLANQGGNESGSSSFNQVHSIRIYLKKIPLQTAGLDFLPLIIPSPC